MQLGDSREGFPKKALFDERQTCAPRQSEGKELSKGLAWADVRTVTHWGFAYLQSNHNPVGKGRGAPYKGL